MARKKTKTSGTATLTEKDRGTIQRLLKTGKPDNVRRAIDLTEAKCNQNQVKELYPDELIVSLASSGNLEVFAVTASFFLRHKKQWERFVQCVTDNKVLQVPRAHYVQDYLNYNSHRPREVALIT